MYTMHTINLDLSRGRLLICSKIPMNSDRIYSILFPDLYEHCHVRINLCCRSMCQSGIDGEGTGRPKTWSDLASLPHQLRGRTIRRWTNKSKYAYRVRTALQSKMPRGHRHLLLLQSMDIYASSYFFFFEKFLPHLTVCASTTTGPTGLMYASQSYAFFFPPI